MALRFSLILFCLIAWVAQVQASIIVFSEDFSDPGSNNYNTSSTTGWNRGGETQNLSLENGKLKVKYKANSFYGGSLRHYFGGVDDSGSYLKSETEHNWVTLKYKFKFQDGFDLAQVGKAGKMPGLAGRRNGGWGCKQPGTNGYEGWSSRMGYKELENGDYKLFAYVYHYDIPSSFGDCGDNIDVGTVEVNTWFDVKMYVRVNTVTSSGGNNDGILRVWLNNVLKVNRTNMRYIDDNEAKITELWVNNHIGGGLPSPQTQYVYIDDVIAESVAVSNKPVAAAQPTNYILNPNYPNPFNPETTISFHVPDQISVKVAIYDELGQLVTTLLNAEVQPGYHLLKWDGTDNTGRRAADGVYFYRMEADEFVQSRKMLLLR